MPKISDHFSVYECEFSEYAIRHGIDNTLPSIYYTNAIEVSNAILEPVRKRFGKFSPSSWYRGDALNKAVNGSKSSQHMIAQAVDFEIVGVSNKEIAEWIRDNLSFDQLILEFFTGAPESGWVHCSYVKGKNRNQVKRTPNGKDYYGGLD